MEFTKLTDTQREQFERDGYLVVPNVLEQPAIDRLVAAGDRLFASDTQVNRTGSREDLYESFRNVIAMDEAFIPLLTHPKVVPLVVQLMSPNLQLLTSHLIYKHPQPEGLSKCKAIGWHRDLDRTSEDLGYANTPRLDIKIAYYLTDLSKPNSGVTTFLPGSHKFKERIKITEGKSNPEGFVEPLLKAGDCVLFENRTWHSAAENYSGHTRKVVMFGYAYQWLRSTDYVSQPESLLEKVGDIGRQFLGGIRNPDERFYASRSYVPLAKWWHENGLPRY